MNLIKLAHNILPQCRRLPQATTIVLFALITGCMHGQQSVSSFDEANFTAQGKIALRYPNCPQYRQCEDKGVSASLDWHHQNDEDSLTFYDPLGQAQASLTYDNGSIMIEEDGEYRQTNANNIEQELGIPIPIEYLRELILNKQNNETFNHQGWQVQVKDWQGQFYRSIRLRQDSYYIRLIIYNIQ